MKRLTCVILAIVLLVSTFSITASAKTNAEIVKSVLRSERTLDVFTKIADVVHDGDAAKIFQTVLVTYPDLIEEIKLASEGGTSDYKSTYVPYNEKTIDVVQHMLKSKLIFEDLAKLVDAVNTNDAGKIFMCILEIYPDFVSEAKYGWEEAEGNSGAASLFSKSEGNVGYIILAGLSGLIIGASVTFAVMKKKKEKAGQA